MSFDLKKLNDKFFTDPDWSQMEEVIMDYLAPMRSVANIPSDLTNDQIATEVRGRQLMLESMDKFLADSKIITRRLTKTTTNYK